MTGSLLNMPLGTITLHAEACSANFRAKKKIFTIQNCRYTRSRLFRSAKCAQYIKVEVVHTIKTIGSTNTSLLLVLEFRAS